jgi:hypothetical protein
MSWGSAICKICQLMKYDINLDHVTFVIRSEMEGEIHRSLANRGILFFIFYFFIRYLVGVTEEWSPGTRYPLQEKNFLENRTFCTVGNKYRSTSKYLNFFRNYYRRVFKITY